MTENNINIRRLPVYLVLDVSGSMAGEPIEAVRQGLKALLSDLRCDPQALETAYLSVVTFADKAQATAPLTDLASFAEPTLTAGGGTALGAALDVLGDRIDAEVRKASPTCRGDYRPLVFLMTDGMPTDAWQPAVDRFRSRKVGNVIACAAGPHADEACLRQITEAVVRLSGLQPDQLKAFFRWVSASVKTTSTKVAPAGQQQAVNLPQLPAGITVVP
jgi:uncharacterized protein YegL